MTVCKQSPRALIESMESRLVLSAGALDPSFGAGGQTALTGAPDGNDVTSALTMSIAVDAQGRTLVASDFFAGHFTQATVTRFNVDGSIDRSFGTYGTFVDPNYPPTYGFTPSSEYINKIVVQPDGKILLIGQNLQRLTTVGKLDPSFRQPATSRYLTSGALLPDGTVLTVDGTDGLITRYNTDGSIHTAYGTAGVYTLPSTYAAVGLHDVELDATGRPVLSAVVKKADGSIYAATIRLTTASLLDTTYGVAGIAPSPVALSDTAGVDVFSPPIAVAPDGSIDQLVSAGDYTPAFLWGYFNNGKTVAGGSPSTTGPFGLLHAALTDLTVQSDGKVIAVGAESLITNDVGTSGAAVDRFLPITPTTHVPLFDATFNGSGGAFAGSGGNGESVALDSQGRILVAGTRSYTGLDSVTRILTTGPTANPPIATTGTVIGTVGSYQNAGNTAAKAFDGNLNTFFDGPTADNNTVGLDLGSTQQIAQISYAPRGGWPGFAARMVGGVFQASSTPDFSADVQDLYTITTTPAAGVLTTVGVGGSAKYRYVRYLSPAGSYGNVAEIVFRRSPQVLTGTPIGTPGSYRNQGNTLANAFDGDPSTFFDGPTATGSWVGLDLGTPTAVTQVSFAPRARFESRMVGGQFQASSTADFSSDVHTVYTITAAPPANGLTTVTTTNIGAYRYWRYIGPTNGQCDVAELAFGG